uniref:Retrovirus-related Pol polyprotein from transposon TNT 1-94 n=1 Tax=Tanacetum cinerariifolium TaxID=118510 RepID=A0A6L2MXJ8_TANCI|nr:hypothetical protein [Tanacetum cinerariifolium]
MKSIIMSCLPDDIMESVISCVLAKETWTDLVYSFEGPSDTKENRIIDLKLKYQTFRANFTESLSQTYTRYKTLLNALANDGVNLSKHEINDFQENSNDEVDERYSEEYLRDLDVEYQERALLVKVLMALVDDELTVGKTHARNDERYSEEYLRDLDVEYQERALLVKVLIALVDDELTVGKTHARNGEWVNITIRKGAFPSSEVMPLTFQPRSPKKRPGLGIIKHTKPETQDSSNKSVLGTVIVSETKQATPSVPTEVKDTEQKSKLNKLTKLVQIFLYCTICKREDHRTLDHEMYIASLNRSENYKAQPYQYASTSQQILKAKAKPFPPCTHYGFSDHKPDDYKNYPECEICRSYDHFTLGHNRVIHIRRGVPAESSQSNESLNRVKCNTCGIIIHSTSNHNEFDHFKRGERIQAAKAMEPTKK